MNISLEFGCTIKILKPTNGVYCESTREGWLYSHPSEYRANPSSFRGVVRNFLDQLYFSNEFTVFIGVVKVKTDKYFEEGVLDIKLRDIGGDFHHSMFIEYGIYEAIRKILERFDYKENFKADITIELKSN